MMHLESVFKQDIPLIDVRAPVEFEGGHFPTSVNLPLMTDEERKQVGIRYKEEGQEAAIALGHALVQGSIKQQRVAEWVKFRHLHPEALLYCFRGGLRSQISIEWIREAGITIERIPGGYKAMRSFLLSTLGRMIPEKPFWILAGKTGSGKTTLLQQVSDRFIDLEKHANHKGSSFGILGSQPAQATFENRIAIDFLKKDSQPFLLLEDESIMIGMRHLPQELFKKMQSSPLIVLEKSMEERVHLIVQEYVIQRLRSANENPETVHQFMRSALDRIQKKLGGLCHRLILDELNRAFSSGRVDQAETHFAWVELLLIHYYDPYYEKGLLKNRSRVRFQGNEAECAEWIRRASNADRTFHTG